MKRIAKLIRAALYDTIVIRDAKTDAWLGDIRCRVIPRIGETLTIKETPMYKVLDVRYDLVDWERFGSVDVVVEHLKS